MIGISIGITITLVAVLWVLTATALAPTDAKLVAWQRWPWRLAALGLAITFLAFFAHFISGGAI